MCGGYQELAALEREGKLDAWLAGAPVAGEPVGKSTGP